MYEYSYIATYAYTFACTINAYVRMYSSYVYIIAPAS